jgi:hypothetical protein
MLARYDRARDKLAELARLGPVSPDALLDVLAIVVDGDLTECDTKPFRSQVAM